jgi:hypothetical protein
VIKSDVHVKRFDELAVALAYRHLHRLRTIRFRVNNREDDGDRFVTSDAYAVADGCVCH